MNVQQKNINGTSRRKRRRILRNLYIVIFILCIGLISILAVKDRFQPENIDQNQTSLANQNTAVAEVDHRPESSVDLNHLTSQDAILSDLTSGTLLGEKNSQRRVYPASLTKIMTAVLALEDTPDLNEEMTLSTDIFSDLYAQGASMAGFEPGEKVVYRDLLYGVLLPSGAECCLAFADSIAGSEAAFADLMNEKAQELGMKNTHFTNSTGLHDENHYTTVEDISILLKYALQNDEFREVFTSSRHSTKPTNVHPDGITFQSTLFKNLDQPEVSNGKILGGKTGYTSEAGLCLASLAIVNDKEYILVTAGAEGSHQTSQFNILDAVSVYSQIGKSEIQ